MQKQKTLCINSHSRECVHRGKCVYHAVPGRLYGLHSLNCKAAFFCVKVTDHWNISDFLAYETSIFFFRGWWWRWWWGGNLVTFSCHVPIAILHVVVDDCGLNKVVSEIVRGTSRPAGRIFMETEDMRLFVLCALLLLLKVSHS